MHLRMIFKSFGSNIMYSKIKFLIAQKKMMMIQGDYQSKITKRVI